MQTRNILQAPAGHPTGPFRLGPDHGYAFDGDRVRLDAELVPSGTDDATGNAWALQLWACDAPFDGRPVRGNKIAEVPVCADDTRISVVADAFPPAGHGNHAMVLVLATGDDGQVCDYANFTHLESFAQPRLQGCTGFAFGDAAVSLRIEGIDNPRAADNLSGTLAAELWALPAPFGTDGTAGGVFLAGANLGRLAGQHAWHDLRVTLPVGTPPAGDWHLALLLREWTAAGYVTRDFSDFSTPVSWADTPAAAPAEAPKATSKGTAKAATGVSINTASATELAAVKGLSKTVAAAIVAARPFAHLDELLKVKGIGAKLLGRLKSRLTL
ncbi:ComEA family DNA-binding protein [Zoogloea sp.]|uniref:ComEA family DNA-binding protein n=1 Tax=Zoogloea sp. TaxID=49181 RepID=UPI0035AD889C